jgi:hydroxyethylthiazole kinase-like uncharacterized protein yjeF
MWQAIPYRFMNGNSAVKVVSAGQMRDIDKGAIEDYAIPAYILMNNAGRSIADFITGRFPGFTVEIFCGKGNNGGDGFAAAYYLRNDGFNVKINLAGKKGEVSETSRLFLTICEKSGLNINEYSSEAELLQNNDSSTVIIDALTGTGFSGSASGDLLKIINIINSANGIVVSADIPSGLPSDGTAPSGEVVCAEYTITMGLPKISLVTYPGASYSGEIITADIGFPSELIEKSNIKITLAGDSLIEDLPFTEYYDTYKGLRGHTLIIGGFAGMEGAGILTSSALFETGAGLVTLMTDLEGRRVIAGKVPELMTIAFPEIPERGKIINLIDPAKFSSMIIGPGMGKTGYSSMIFTIAMETLEKTAIKRVLIDGDGLYHLAAYLRHKKLPDNIEFIITPHFMEASVISGKTVEEIRSSRLKSCIDIAKSTGTVCLLKGPASIISDGVYSIINTSGNSSLATAGSGDVLSGITGSFMNMDIPLLNAGASAMYIHGICAEIYSSMKCSSTMKAGDIIGNIRNSINLSLTGEM